MSAAERYLTLSSGQLRLELEELYAAYTACLDEERFEEWPEFFVEQCLYKIVPRENFERGLPLATWLCESKGYLADRVTAIPLLDEFTRVFNTGQYRDKLVVEEGRLKFKEKLCIFDSLLVPNSLIYPL